jgi:hypothetical protein
VANEKVIVKQTTNKVIVSTPGHQGPRGRTILNGVGAPSNNLGLEGDFYYDTVTTRFYGPKPSDITWSGAQNYILNNPPTDYSFEYPWSLPQVQGPTNGYYFVEIVHNLGFNPNITVQDSAGDLWETGIIYNTINKITLTMAQPFSGTAYLS